MAGGEGSGGGGGGQIIKCHRKSSSWHGGTLLVQTVNTVHSWMIGNGILPSKSEADLSIIQVRDMAHKSNNNCGSLEVISASVRPGADAFVGIQRPPYSRKLGFGHEMFDSNAEDSGRNFHGGRRRLGNRSDVLGGVGARSFDDPLLEEQDDTGDWDDWNEHEVVEGERVGMVLPPNGPIINNDHEFEDGTAGTSDQKPAAGRAAHEEVVPFDLRCDVCLELFLQPHGLHPCTHVFCASCLRLLAKAQSSNPINTCPVCRSPIFWAVPDKDLERRVQKECPDVLEQRELWLEINRSVESLPLPGARFLGRPAFPALLRFLAASGPAVSALCLAILCLLFFFLLFVPGVYISSNIIDYVVHNLTVDTLPDMMEAVQDNALWAAGLALQSGFLTMFTITALTAIAFYLIFVA